MAIRDIFKVSFKTFVNPSAWLGYSALKTNTKNTFTILRELFNPPELTESTETTETFESALKRYKVNDSDLKEREKDYFFYACLFLLLSLFSFCMGFYLLFVKGTLVGLVLGIAVTALFGSQAFRFHFWYFQITQRKLGCTLDEWWQGFFSHKKRPSA